MNAEVMTPEEARQKTAQLQARVDEITAYMQNAKREYHAKRTIASAIPALLKEKRELHGRIVALRQYVESQ